MQTHLYKNDLDDGIVFKGNVAIDTAKNRNPHAKVVGVNPNIGG